MKTENRNSYIAKTSIIFYSPTIMNQIKDTCNIANNTCISLQSKWNFFLFKYTRIFIYVSVIEFLKK